MTKNEVERLKARLEAEYKRKLDAVALVEEMLAEEPEPARLTLGTNGNGSSAHQSDQDEDETDTDTLIGRVSALFAADVGKKWTVARIEQDLRARGYKFQAEKPSVSIHTCIAKLKERGAVRVARHGKGSKPSLYSGVEKSLMNQNTE